MAEGRRCTPTGPLDINQILSEAQNRWLRPVEICEILQNYRKFSIAPEPPNRPPNGALFLFDRKQLRYFRKDGHSWRKKKDGKTVKEAHERLKAGSVDVLHCYYAHGEENENFQRRSYWMLEEDLMHIVLVHYREVKGNRTSSSRGREAEEIIKSPSLGSSPASSNFVGNYDQSHSQTTDTSSLTSTLMSEFEDPESDNHQASSRYHSYTELQQYDDGLMTNQIDVRLFNNYHSGSSSVNNPGDYGVEQSHILGINYAPVPQRNIAKEISDGGFELNFSEPDKKMAVAPSWEGILEQCSIDSRKSLHQSTQPVGMIGQVCMNEVGLEEANIEDLCNQPQWQVSAVDNCNLPMWPVDLKMPSDLACLGPAGFETELSSTYLPTSTKSASIVSDQQTESASIVSDQQIRSPLPNEIQSISDNSSLIKADTGGSNDRLMEIKRSLLEEEGLKKLDSFSRWMSRELGEVHEANALSTSVGIWTSVEGGDAIEVSTFSAQDPLDEYLLSPSLSQDQLFSIYDFSPNWTFTDVEAKVLVMGTFLKTKNEMESYRWSCMFGELEVPAEVLGEGILRCSTPLHKAGLVPFYVTCSNRLACSEIREFEYRVCQDKSIDNIDTSADELSLLVRLGKLLSLGPSDRENVVSGSFDKYHEEDKISSPSDGNAELLAQMLKITSEGGFILDSSKEQLLQNLFMEQLPKWLLQKMTEDGKGPNILDDEEGQGVIHLVSALGYDWAIEPIVAAGVNINFRDLQGWTALHWAAFYGRLRTVAILVSMGAFTWALTDPTPQYPSGRTPADLASSNGHKGIGGYLAESSLTAHLSNLTLKEGLKDGNQLESSGTKAIQTVAERSPVPHGVDDVPEGLSLKDSLTAVCNAEQAAARIHEVFRAQSFQRKQVIEYEGDKFGISDERALSLIAMKSKYPGRYDLHAHDAALRIQNKFRGWKGRKEFLIMRRSIVKIQALVRGHQVRKKYKSIIWSVGIVEKVILRWRRKGSGLRGFRSDARNEGPSMQIESAKEDDYDFLREGRRQTEARLDKALARVRSMVQYPEARDQYRRLLTVVNEIQERKLLLNESDVNMNDDMFDLEALLEDDSFMPTAT